MEPQDHVPDLVFTANAGLVSGKHVRAVPLPSPRAAARDPVFAAWFEAAGYTVERLPEELDHEGAGDALPFFDEDGQAVLLSGYRPRSDAAAGAVLSELLGCPVRSVELIDERLYHVDLTFCPIDDRHAICAPLGWDAYGRKVVEALVPEPLWLEERRGARLLRQLRRRRPQHRHGVGAAAGRAATRGVGAVSRRVAGRRVPQGRRRLPLPHPRLGREAGVGHAALPAAPSTRTWRRRRQARWIQLR